MNQFVESMKRLFKGKKVGKEKIIKLFEEGKITEDEKNYIIDDK